jgi:hypothetical protein
MVHDSATPLQEKMSSTLHFLPIKMVFIAFDAGFEIVALVFSGRDPTFS